MSVEGRNNKVFSFCTLHPTLCVFIDPDTLRTELEKGGGRQRLKDMLLAEGTSEYITEKSQGTKGE
jgi:hypothetical protein